jgi:hypothetical protein
LVGSNELFQSFAFDQFLRLLVEAEQCFDALHYVPLFEIHLNYTLISKIRIIIHIASGIVGVVFGGGLMEVGERI